MTRTVSDAAILLGAITGIDPADDATVASEVRSTPDYTAALKPDGLKGSRIGVARTRYFGYSPATDKLIDQAIADMKAQSATIIDPANIPTAARLDDCEFEILLYEFKADLNKYLASRGASAPVHSLKDLIAFNLREREREMPFFEQEILVRAEKKGSLTSPAYRTALTSCRARSRTLGIDAVMTKFRLDALVAPTGSPAWPTDLINGDHFTGASSTPAAVAGYPSITVPAGFVHGLPVGISFIGRPWTEAKLISLGVCVRAGDKASQAADICAGGEILNRSGTRDPIPGIRCFVLSTTPRGSRVPDHGSRQRQILSTSSKACLIASSPCRSVSVGPPNPMRTCPGA